MGEWARNLIGLKWVGYLCVYTDDVNSPKTVWTNPTDFWLCFSLTLNVNSKPLTCFFPFIHFLHPPLHDFRVSFVHDTRYQYW